MKEKERVLEDGIKIDQNYWCCFDVGGNRYGRRVDRVRVPLKVVR